MAHVVRDGIMDKHLNVFYPYKTNHLEDNVTRSLIICLSQLSPVHVRSFLKDLVLQDKPVLRDRMDLMAEPDFTYDLQIGTWEDELLTQQNGVILGITWSRSLDLKHEDHPPIDEKGRPDALLVDRANDIAVVFESKLSDALYPAQLQRHLNRTFDASVTSLDDVLVTVSWTQIAEYLQKVASVSVASHEGWVIQEFLEYLERLQLVDFLGFRQIDFVSENEPKLHRFLGHAVAEYQSDLQLKEYGRNNMVFFDDSVGPDNLYVTVNPAGFTWGIVCGSGKKWRVEQLKRSIVKSPAGLGVLIDKYAAQFEVLDFDPKISLAIHTYFRLSRFRTEWLPDVEGRRYKYPDEFDDFCRCFSDDRLNSLKRISKEVINRDFAGLIEREDPRRDSNGLFPRWEDKDEFLQYAYFHIDADVPMDRAGSTPRDALGLFERLSTFGKELVEGLRELR